LATRTFLVTERITLADITLASVIHNAVAITLDAATRKGFPNVIRHLETVVHQPNLVDVFGPIEYIEKAKERREPKPTPAPPPKAEKVI